MFSSNQEFYDYVGKIVVWLNESGNTAASNELKLSLHKGATSGEVFDDLLGAFEELKDRGVFVGSEHEKIVDEIIIELTKLVNN